MIISYLRLSQLFLNGRKSRIRRFREESPSLGAQLLG